MAKDYDYLFKLLLIGDSGVGKRSMLLRFADSLFYETFRPAIGIDFQIRTLNVDGKRIKLLVWNTAGMEKHKSITTAYYRGTSGIILLYDITSLESFDSIKNWIDTIKEHVSADVERILIGNKSDMEDKRQVTREMGEKLANQYRIKFLEISVKTNVNVDEAFLSLAKDIAEKTDKKARTGPADKSAVIKLEQDIIKNPGIGFRSCCSFF